MNNILALKDMYKKILLQGVYPKDTVNLWLLITVLLFIVIELKNGNPNAPFP